jgi:hypothetical protein
MSFVASTTFINIILFNNRARLFNASFNVFGDLDKIKIFFDLIFLIRKKQNIENYASERFFYDVDIVELLEEAKTEGQLK